RGDATQRRAVGQAACARTRRNRAADAARFPVLPDAYSVTRVRVDAFRAVEDRRIGLALDIEEAGQALLGAAERVVHQDVPARVVHLELDHRRAARGHQRGLHVGQWRTGQRGLVIDLVEDLADQVQAGDQVRAADAEVHAYRLTDVGLHHVVLGQRGHRAVE